MDESSPQMMTSSAPEAERGLGDCRFGGASEATSVRAHYREDPKRSRAQILLGYLYMMCVNK